MSAKGGLVDLFPIPPAAWVKKEPRESGALQTKSCPAPPCFVYFLAYQSAFIAVNFCHFSGRSSRAKIAVTGHTGTQAPQSMHSTGLMYSIVSFWEGGSSLRGWMQSTGHTSTHAESLVLMQGSAIT